VWGVLVYTFKEAFMDLNKKGFQLPKKLEFEEGLTDTEGRLVVEPLERGFGTTIGNSLRRVMLSSLEGAAVTSIRIPGVLHEFDTMAGVKEDVVDIILNVKQLRMRLNAEGERHLKLAVKGPKEITAADIEADASVEILNPGLSIATIDKDTDFEMEMTVRKGRGFIPADQNKDEEQPVDVIAVDSIFTPIKSVNFEVEKARVGRSSDYDRLYMDISTDGSITPEDAVTQAATILGEHLDLFILNGGCEMDDDLAGGEYRETDISDETPIFTENLLKSVDELELSVRSYNCLKNADIQTIGDLVQRSDQEMLKTKNFGRKSLNEIKAILKTMGLRFGMRIDVEAFEAAMARKQAGGGSDAS